MTRIYSEVVISFAFNDVLKFSNLDSMRVGYLVLLSVYVRPKVNTGFAYTFNRASVMNLIASLKW